MDESLDPGRLRYLVERRRRKRIAAAIVPAFIGVLLLMSAFLSSDFWFGIIGVPPQIGFLLGLALLTLSGASVLMIYLQTGFKHDPDAEFASFAHDVELNSLRKQVDDFASSRDPEVARLSTDLDSVRNDVAKITNSAFGIDEEQRLTIVNDLKARVRDEVASSLLAEIETKVAASYQQLARDREIETHFQESRSRLSQEIGALGRRGNLNLVLGIATTIAGLVLLGAFVLSTREAPKDSWDFAVHFVPRLTLVVFIETFAYFFLSLYKASLSEIKYFQNELTNIEGQCIALKTAVAIGENGAIKEIVNKVGSTERNFILGKNQTTVELERARMDKEGLTDLTKHLASLLPKKS